MEELRKKGYMKKKVDEEELLEMYASVDCMRDNEGDWGSKKHLAN